MFKPPDHFSVKIKIPLLILLAIVLLVVLAAPGVFAKEIFMVTNTNDDGAGSLREAIELANANPGQDLIAFNVSGRSRGAYTIQPTSPLPQITESVIIDGYTQPGARRNTNGPSLGSNAVLKIELDGSMAGANFVHGLHIVAAGSTVRGMAINRFSGNGIAIFGNEATGNLVQGNFIGTDVLGTVALGNLTDGVQIRGAANNTIGATTAEARNVISGNEVRGISIQGEANMDGRDATGNLVQGNLIGTNVTGTEALGNTQDGIQIRGAANNTIGGATAGARNVISCRTDGGRGGVSIVNHPNLLITGASGNLVQGNFIGLDVTGTAALGNGSRGVMIEEAANNILTDNTISNNYYGIQLVSSRNNQIYNNNFINNTIQAYITGHGSNIFNLEKPRGGNYWRDWTGPDTDGNGFVDSAYVFDGGVDYLPWVSQNGWPPVPNVYYVNAVDGDNNNDGLTLQTALATIQRGIDSAAHGDTVIVAPATYTGGGNRDLDFRGKAITVCSIDPNDQNVVAATIIDCQGTKEEPYRGFYFHSGETSSAVLDGFTIKNGYTHPGAGIYCSDSGPIIKNCIITENTAESSNGIGGGCFFSNSFAEIINCEVTLNSAIGTSRHSGNGWGGGIACEGSTIKIINTEINNNYATFDSGGVGAGWNSQLYIDNCVISNNSSQFGSGLKFQDSNINITNSTITKNSVEYSGGGFYCIRSNIIVTNSILWADTGGEIDGWDSSITVTYSDVQGGWEGEGNINTDPLFVSSAHADYHLQESSPCIDAGDNSAIAQSVIVDLDGKPRILDGIVDMGAYEAGEESPLAFNPEPADGAKNVSANVELSWSSGSGAQLHIVYFGDNFDDVNNDAGGILHETTTYTPGSLESDKVYYWRVDEFDGVVIHKGDVWSFTVAGP